MNIEVSVPFEEKSAFSVPEHFFCEVLCFFLCSLFLIIYRPSASERFILNAICNFMQRPPARMPVLLLLPANNFWLPFFLSATFSFIKSDALEP